MMTIKGTYSVRPLIIIILLLIGTLSLPPFTTQVQAAFIVWPGDHIIDGVTEYYGPGDVINEGGNIFIRNDGELTLDGAVLNFTDFGKGIGVGDIGNGTLNIIGGGETRIVIPAWSYGIGGQNGKINLDGARILDTSGVGLSNEIDARINNTLITNTTSTP